MLNALTVDVEDYFHVSAFAHLVSPQSWPSFESRVCRNTRRLLSLFDRAGVKATFFVLGWVAERFPEIVREIHLSGHELASHSFDHGLVFDKDPEDFRRDLERARNAIASACGVRVRGFRAPSFSITSASLWALDLLVAEGYDYDASIYPIRHDRYGIPGWHRHVHRIECHGGSLWELPGSTVRRAGTNMPVGGGGYFRLLPYAWTRHGIRWVNEREEQPTIFYLHPWEIDPEQPRIACGALSRVRHYHNLDATEARLQRLLSEFRFGTVSEVLEARRRDGGASSVRLH